MPEDPSLKFLTLHFRKSIRLSASLPFRARGQEGETSQVSCRRSSSIGFPKKKLLDTSVNGAQNGNCKNHMSFHSTTMAYDESIRKRILDRCRSRFFSLGFTKVTMDEMAHELGVSKKTIYKHFPSKTQLLRELLSLKMDEAQSGIERIARQNRLSFVQKLKEAYTFAGLTSAATGPF
jgi:hypothetical protein